MHVDYAHSITLGRNKELYYLGTSALTERANSHAAQLLRRIAKGIILSSKRYQHSHILISGDDGIWSEIDLLEGDPVHRGVAMRNPRFKPFWLRAEGIRKDGEGIPGQGTYDCTRF